MLWTHPDHRPVPPQRVSSTILIVDNDDAIRDLAETVLRQAGYPVLTAPDGVSAFRLLERHPEIDLLFTDIVMPRIDGLMLADMAKLRRPHLKVLYATAYRDEMNRQPGYRYGEILPKPYRARDIEVAVRRALATPPMRVHPAA
jgi:CheY-like chemotaxis protein